MSKNLCTTMDPRTIINAAKAAICSYLKTHKVVYLCDDDFNEVVQRVCLKVYTRMHTYDPQRAGIPTWVGMMTATTISDFLKERSYRGRWAEDRIVDPKKVQVVRTGGRTVSETVLDNTNAYFAAYVTIIVGSFLLLSLDGQTVGTNLSAVLACFNNIGPGLEAVGPTQNFSQFSDWAKLLLSFDMLAGRLEIFPMLILFSRSSWRRR